MTDRGTLLLLGLDDPRTGNKIMNSVCFPAYNSTELEMEYMTIIVLKKLLGMIS